MEKELESKIFILHDYLNKEEMENDIKKYINKLKSNYPSAMVSREFYKGRNVLVRATKLDSPSIKKNNLEKEYELEKEEVRIKEKGINGLGENISRTQDERNKKGKTRGRQGRERSLNK